MLAILGSQETSPPAPLGDEEEILPDPYYTPTRVDRWLRDWPLLESLAETPRSSRHYLTWEHRNRKGACQNDPKVEQRGTAYFGDELSYADIKADLERAWIHLRREPNPRQDPVEGAPASPRVVRRSASTERLDSMLRSGSSGRWGLHFGVIEWRLRFRPDSSGAWRPTGFREIEEALSLRHGAASTAYREAVEFMAWRLGWTGRDCDWDNEPVD